MSANNTPISKEELQEILINDEDYMRKAQNVNSKCLRNLKYLNLLY